MSSFATNAVVRRASRKRVFSWRGGAAARFLTGLAAAGAGALLLGQSAQAAAITYIGGTSGVWSNSAVWSPAQVPGILDSVTFNGAAANTVLLGGNQSALGLLFQATSGTTSVRASTAGQILSLGTGGIQFGSTQTDLGGGGTSAMVVALMGSQSWTGSGAGGLIQLNNGSAATQQSITNGTAGAVNLTFDGVSTGGKTIYGAIDDGILGGTTALTLNTTGGFGSLVLIGTNTYSGGTTLTQGFLDVRNSASLGTGALNFTNNALTKQVTSGLIGGVTLNNNALNLNGTITLGGSQNINFGTGATTLGSATTLLFNGTTNPVNYTLGGSITGANNLTIGATGTNTNSLLNLTGTNTSNSTAKPLTILGQTVKFGSGAVPTGTGAVVLNGGSIAVGTGSAYTTLASLSTDTRVTKTAGAFALLGDSSENFTTPNANISLGAALGSVARYTGTLTPSGTTYNVGGGGGTIVFSNTNAFTGTRGLNTNGANFNTFGGGGTVIVNGLNNFDGAVGIGVGTLEVNSIGTVGGSSSALGAPTTAANGTITFGTTGQTFSQLRYTGVGETSNRTLNFSSFSGSASGLDASGTGAINFGGTFTQTSNSTNRFLTLRGINTGANTIAGSIGITGTAGGLNLTKAQRGNWTLTNTNNFAGTNVSSSGIQINGGTLTADYTTNANILGATGTNLTLGGGTLAMVYNGAGTATQSIGTGATTPLTTLTANTGQSNISVTGNGTAGSAVLTMGNNFTRNAGTFLNFNLINGGQVSTGAALTNGLLATGANGGAFTVTDSSGSDFATVTGGQIAKLGASTALPASGSVSTTNYVLTGSQTLTATDAVNSLRIDTSAGGGTLSLAGFNVTPTAGVILKDGTNPYTISGTAIGASGAAVVLASYGGNLTVAANAAAGAGSLTKTGTGLVDLTSAQSYTGATNIFGGVLRLSNSTFGTGNITLNTGGILEIGADQNGATAGDFSRQVGTGANQVQWTNGDGGFSAAGANRAVALTNNLGVASGQLVWGSISGNNNTVAPNASPNFVKDGFALLLSSSTATGTIDFQNPIDFVNMSRTVQVGDGTQAVDAVLSGTLSSSDYSGGLYKTGAGTLAVTNANTYTGATSVAAGTLAVNNTSGSGTGAGVVTITAAGTLTGTGTAAGAVIDNGTINAGSVGTVGTLTTGAETYNGGSSLVFDFGNNAVDGLVSTGLVSSLSGVNFVFNSIGDGTLLNPTYTLIAAGSFADNILPGSVTGTPSGYQLQYNGTGTELDLVQIAAAPEPSQWAAFGIGLLGLGGLALRARRRGHMAA